MNTSPNSIAVFAMRGGHFSAARGTTETVLLLIGLAFAGLLVWAIEHSRRTTSR
jgi:hypothetical protein